MRVLLIWGLTWLGGGLVFAMEQPPDENVPIVLTFRSPTDSQDYTVTVTDYTLAGVGDVDCPINISLFPEKAQRGVYQTKVTGSKECHATTEIVNSYSFSPSKNWLDRGKHALRFTLVILPNAEMKKIGVPRSLVSRWTPLPAIAQRVEARGPSPKGKVKPSAPGVWRQGLRLQGTCHVKFFIDEKGKPYDVKLQKCPKVFHKNTLSAAKRWRFRPAVVLGEPVRSQYIVAFRYQ